MAHPPEYLWFDFWVKLFYNKSQLEEEICH